MVHRRSQESKVPWVNRGVFLFTLLITMLLFGCKEDSSRTLDEILPNLDPWPLVEDRLQQAVTPAIPGAPCNTAEACGLEFRAGDASAELWYDGVFGDWERDQRTALASGSKWLTAAAVLTLVDDGWLDLDEPIATYWAGLDDKPHGEITLRQLLSHTSGLPHQSPCVNEQILYTLQQCAEEVLSLPLVDEPGTIFLYGAAGYQVVGAIAERVTGMSWQQLFNEQLAEPMGMTQTGYGSSTGDQEDTQNPRLAGGVVTTASEHYAFLEMMLRRGEYRGKRILSEAAWEAMRLNNTEDVRRFDCPLSEDECRPFWTGAVGFLVGNPDQDHFSYGLGNWLFRTDNSGRGVIMSSPGAWGTHGWIDTERNYRGLLTMDGNYNDGKAIFDDILALLNTAISP